MNTVLKTPSRLLCSLSTQELIGISNAINEVCNGVNIADAEFETRLGVSREFLSALLTKLHADAHDALKTFDHTNAWADGASVQAICISASGDPVDMSTEEAQAFVECLQQAINKAN